MLFRLKSPQKNLKRCLRAAKSFPKVLDLKWQKRVLSKNHKIFDMKERS